MTNALHITPQVTKSVNELPVGTIAVKHQSTSQGRLISIAAKTKPTPLPRKSITPSSSLTERSTKPVPKLRTIFMSKGGFFYKSFNAKNVAGLTESDRMRAITSELLGSKMVGQTSNFLGHDGKLHSKTLL